MKLNLINTRGEPGGRRESGLTLLEILVASSLLVVIITGLMLMFNQTQKVFRSGLKQVDVMENGRVAIDMIRRDLEQMQPCMQPAPEPHSYNFMVTNSTAGTFPIYNPDGKTVLRTNHFAELYFLTTDQATWSGVGYTVGVLKIDDVAKTTNFLSPEMGVGTLYLFKQSDSWLNISNTWEAYVRARQTTTPTPPVLPSNPQALHKVIDGVVHFRITAYDSLGRVYTNYFTPSKPFAEPFTVVNSPDNDQHIYSFKESKLPSYVELELGVLEQAAYERLKGFDNVQAATNFLGSQGGKIHYFRQQIPIRTVIR